MKPRLKLASEPLTPCPSRFSAVLGFPSLTLIPCGLLAGHEGWHRYQAEWADSAAAPSPAVTAPTDGPTPCPGWHGTPRCDERAKHWHEWRAGEMWIHPGSAPVPSVVVAQPDTKEQK